MSAIEKNPNLPYNFFELQPHERIGDYGRAYGDEIARRYEHGDIIYIPQFPLPIDLAFFQALSVSDSIAKLGTGNGIEDGIFVRDKAEFRFDRNHVLYKICKTEGLAAYFQQQVRTCDDQIREALRILFPKYYSLFCGNITWRITDTPTSIMHIDHFNNRQPTPDYDSFLHKIKLFINIDQDLRHWRTSYTLPEILARYRHELPPSLPINRNLIAWILADMDLLKDAPSHAIAFPTMSALIINADVASHQVISGKRVIAAEFFCEQRDMLEPNMHPQARMEGWFKEYGYTRA